MGAIQTRRELSNMITGCAEEKSLSVSVPSCLIVRYEGPKPDRYAYKGSDGENKKKQKVGTTRSYSRAWSLFQTKMDALRPT